MESGDLKPIRSGVPTDWLLNALASRGVGRSDICRELKLKNSLFNSAGAILPVEIYNEIFEWAALKVEDPALGIHIAESPELPRFGVLGYLVNNAATLKDGFEIIERYHCIFTPEFSISFSHERKRCRCQYQGARLPDSATRQDIEFTLGTLVESIRGLVGSVWTPNRCTFTCSAPEALTEHRRIFGENLQFDRAQNSFDLDECLLSTPNAQADPNLLHILKQQANQLFDQMSGKRDLVRHVRLLITTSLGHDALNTETAARHLNMSVRSLHRQLSERHTSFRELRDDTILRVAKEALLDTDASITDIAMKLGYSESSAFVRVFKRLTGASPLQFRKQGCLPD